MQKSKIILILLITVFLASCKQDAPVDAPESQLTKESHDHTMELLDFYEQNGFPEIVNFSDRDFDSDILNQARKDFLELHSTRNVNERTINKYLGTADWDWTYAHRSCFNFDQGFYVPLRKDKISSSLLLYLKDSDIGYTFLIANKEILRSILFSDKLNAEQTEFFASFYDLFNFADHNTHTRDPRVGCHDNHTFLTHIREWLDGHIRGGTGGGNGGGGNGGSGGNGGLGPSNPGLGTGTGWAGGGGGGGASTSFPGPLVMLPGDGTSSGPSYYGEDFSFCESSVASIELYDEILLLTHLDNFESSTGISEINGATLFEVISPSCTTVTGYDDFEECMINSIGCELGYEPSEWTTIYDDVLNDCSTDSFEDCLCDVLIQEYFEKFELDESYILDEQLQSQIENSFELDNCLDYSEFQQEVYEYFYNNPEDIPDYDQLLDCISFDWLPVGPDEAYQSCGVINLDVDFYYFCVATGKFGRYNGKLATVYFEMPRKRSNGYFVTEFEASAEAVLAVDYAEDQLENIHGLSCPQSILPGSIGFEFKQFLDSALQPFGGRTTTTPQYGNVPVRPASYHRPLNGPCN